jgi:hypothetical protein
MNHGVLVACATGLALASGAAMAQQDPGLEDVVVMGSYGVSWFNSAGRTVYFTVECKFGGQ